MYSSYREPVWQKIVRSHPEKSLLVQCPRVLSRSPSDCAPWPQLACSHHWFHGWLQLFLDYSCVVFGAKGKTRLTRLWICELSWKARGLVLMERAWTHTYIEQECTHFNKQTDAHRHRIYVSIASEDNQSTEIVKESSLFNQSLILINKYLHVNFKDVGR